VINREECVAILRIAELTLMLESNVFENDPSEVSSRGGVEVARAERAAAIETTKDIFAEIATCLSTKFREWIKKADAGDLGHDIAVLALAFIEAKKIRRYRVGSSILVADILSSKK